MSHTKMLNIFNCECIVELSITDFEVFNIEVKKKKKKT